MKTLKEELNQTRSLSNRCKQIRRISDRSKDAMNIPLRTLLKNTFSFKTTMYERECNRFIVDFKKNGWRNLWL